MTLRRHFIAALCGVAALFAGGAAYAEFAKINSEETFRSVVSGKTLVRPLVRLQVSPQGRISGTGASWDVTGTWRWRDGYFCRDLSWGGSDLGYNCQEVAVSESRIRFTSDKGTGKSADFRLSRD